MNRSSALEYSSQPPVSVYGTGRLACFSWRMLNQIITAAGALVYYQDITVPFNALFRLCALVPHPRHFLRGRVREY